LRPDVTEDEEVWIEFRGVSLVCGVFINGKHIGNHKGGYSTFRVNITPELVDENVVSVDVDNSYAREVYPQKADFTFYGGIYRDVYLLVVPKEHFCLGLFGGKGIKVTPQILRLNTNVRIEAFTENVPDGYFVILSINGIESKKAVVNNNTAKAEMVIENARLWNGLADPFLYTGNIAAKKV
jgi:beta-galactosidase